MWCCFFVRSVCGNFLLFCCVKTATHAHFHQSKSLLSALSRTTTDLPLSWLNSIISSWCNKKAVRRYMLFFVHYLS